jgi:hypothetical protein
MYCSTDLRHLLSVGFAIHCLFPSCCCGCFCCCRFVVLVDGVVFVLVGVVVGLVFLLLCFRRCFCFVFAVGLCETEQDSGPHNPCETEQDSGPHYPCETGQDSGPHYPVEMDWTWGLFRRLLGSGPPWLSPVPFAVRISYCSLPVPPLLFSHDYSLRPCHYAFHSPHRLLSALFYVLRPVHRYQTSPTSIDLKPTTAVADTDFARYLLMFPLPLYHPLFAHLNGAPLTHTTIPRNHTPTKGFCLGHVY